MEITSLTNAKVKQWVRYREKKYRDMDQSFLIEGEHLIEEAHRAGCIRYLILEQHLPNPYPQYDAYTVTSQILHKISSHVSAVKMIAVCRYKEPSVEKGLRMLALDDVQDPGNMGTMIRTAVSFGYSALLLSQRCADIYNEKVIRSTQGALFHLSCCRCCLEDMLPQLQQEGYHIYGTSLHDAVPLQQIQRREKHVLLMGNEGSGVRRQLLDLCDERIFIEMDFFESLNVGVAAGICMYHFRHCE